MEFSSDWENSMLRAMRAAGDVGLKAIVFFTDRRSGKNAKLVAEVVGMLDLQFVNPGDGARTGGGFYHHPEFIVRLQNAAGGLGRCQGVGRKLSGFFGVHGRKGGKKSQNPPCQTARRSDPRGKKDQRRRNSRNNCNLPLYSLQARERSTCAQCKSRDLSPLPRARKLVLERRMKPTDFTDCTDCE